MLVKKPVDPVNKQEAKLGQGAGSSLSDKTRGSSHYYEDSGCSARKQEAIMPVYTEDARCPRSVDRPTSTQAIQRGAKNEQYEKS